MMNELQATDNSDVLMRYLRLHGSHSLAYSAIQDGMSYFVLDGAGFIPYAVPGADKSVAYCLSDPVASPGDYGRLLDAFLERFPRAAFIQVTERFAEVLERAGFFVNELGVETEIRLRGYSLSGRGKQSHRRTIRKALAAGTVVEELRDPSSVAAELRGISNEWLRSKAVSDRELKFIARKAVFDHEPDVRKFAARINKEYTGFVFFTPMYDGGTVYGYLTEVLRASTDAPSGTITLIIQRAIDRFREEGKEVVSLGISPFFDISDDRFRHSALMRHAFKTLYRAGNGIFPFRNLSYAKSRFGGGVAGGSYRDANVEKKKVYLAHLSRFPVRVLYESSVMAGLIDGIWPTVKKTIAGAKP